MFVGKLEGEAKPPDGGAARAPAGRPLGPGACIAVFGASGPLCVEVEESCARLGVVISALFLNRDAPALVLDLSRLRHVRDLAPGEAAGTPFAAPLFTPANRRAAVAEALSLGLVPAGPLLDPTAIVAASTRFGEGCYVNAGCILGAASVFGRFVVVNRGASIGHHAQVGDFASVGPGCVIAGQVTIGEGAVIGAAAVLSPGVAVGAGAAVAPGAVVTRDVPPGQLALGNPARLAPRAPGGAG